MASTLKANTMKAWVQRGFGGPEVRNLEDFPKPVPQKGEVLLKIAAVALNRLDILQRKAALVGTFKLPHIAGMDFVGEVVEATSPDGEALIGKMVVADPVVICKVCDRCREGLEAYCREFRTCGSSRYGALAEYVALPAENCIPVDTTHIQLHELACVPVASVTAWHGLLAVGSGIKAGETIVVPGGGSGLGSAGVQIAKHHGCKVITLVAGAEKAEKAKQLGADLIIDRKAQDWVKAVIEYTSGRGADMVWDHVGGPFLQQAIDATRLDGRIIMSGTTAGNDSQINNASLFHWGKSILGHGGYTRDELKAVVASYCAGELKLILDSKWDFADFKKAEARLESDEFFGKIVLTL